MTIQISFPKCNYLKWELDRCQGMNDKFELKPIEEIFLHLSILQYLMLSLLKIVTKWQYLIQISKLIYFPHCMELMISEVRLHS